MQPLLGQMGEGAVAVRPPASVAGGGPSGWTSSSIFGASPKSWGERPTDRRRFDMDMAADLDEEGGRPALPPHSTAAARKCHLLTEQVADK